MKPRMPLFRSLDQDLERNPTIPFITQVLNYNLNSVLVGMSFNVRSYCLPGRKNHEIQFSALGLSFIILPVPTSDQTIYHLWPISLYLFHSKSECRKVVQS